MSKLRTIWNNAPLGTKFSLISSFLLVVLTITFTTVTILRERTSTQQSLKEQAELLQTTLGHELREPLYLLEIDELRELTTVVNADENITFVRVYDAEGKILAAPLSSDLLFTSSPLGLTLSELGEGQVYFSEEAEQFVTGQQITVGNQLLGSIAVGYSTESLKRELRTAAAQSVLIGVASILVGVVLVVYISRQIVNPIKDLAETARLIRDGDLSKRARNEGQDEIGSLARSFNEMTEQLQATLTQEQQARRRTQEANLKLQESEAMLERRVEERTQELALVNIELEAALQQAKEADAIKSQFLASMSHELRTPLNAILSFSKYMRQGIFGPVTDEQVDYLGKTVDSGEHLLSLINDVLDVTKIQSGMLKLYVEEGFDVEQELGNILASAEKMLGDKSVKLVQDIDHNLPLLTCDKRRVRQIFYNLVSNALKFTEEGEITISARQNNGNLVVSVDDTGPGIAVEEQQLIFEPFIQTETGIKHAGGTGLGLPISKELAQAHGGRLWVESEVGGGAQFCLALPVKPLVTEEEDKLEVSQP